MSIAWFEKLQAILAHEDPESAFVDTNTVKRIPDFAASLGGFGANPFDDQVNRLVDGESGSGRSQAAASQHALLPAQRFLHATSGGKRVSARTASNG